jgi:hypothetical protein
MMRSIVLATVLCLAIAALGIGTTPALADGRDYNTAVPPTDGTPVHATYLPARPTAKTPKGAITTTRPTFRWSRVARATDYDVRVSVGGKLLVQKPHVTGLSWKSSRALPRGIFLTWKVRARSADGHGVWSRSLVLMVAPLYQPYFGDLHAHTSVSDGSGTPAGAYASARAAGMDFFAVTDHSTMITPQMWTATRAAADAATSPTFVGVAAYELSWDHHHVNTFAVESIIPKSVGATTDLPAVDFIDPLLAYPGAIGQFNHPHWNDHDDFDDFAGRTRERDAVMSLLELYNGLGVDTRDSSSYVKCLDAGWHVMPTASSDAHSINSDTTTAPYEYRTVLLAPGLTRPELFDAMRDNRGYASMDRNLRIDFTANEAEMGSTITPARRYAVWVAATDPDALVPGDRITKLEVVGDGGVVVASRRADGHSVTWMPTVSSSTARYFWVRVTAGDGVAAWTAPVWTGR